MHLLLSLRPAWLVACCTVALWSAAPLAAQTRPIELEDLFRLQRVSDPQLSPDGQHIAYVVTEVLKDENRTQSDLWLVPVAGGTPRKLTASPKHDRHPRWSPDGRWLAFESNRDGDFQIWLLPITGAGEARKVTSLSTGASQPIWSPDGSHLVFVSAVFAEFSAKPFAEADQLNQEKLDAREKSKVKARVATQLLFRHWDSWVEDKRQHLFMVPVKDGVAAGEPRNVTPGENDAVPTSSTFDGGNEYSVSPDGKHLVFCAPPLPIREQAWSTNHDLWMVDLTSGQRTQLTTNPAADGLPRWSPDGKLLAYRAQRRAGFEADRWELMIYDPATKQHRSLTADLDRSVDSITWSPDSRTLFFLAQYNGLDPIWSVPASGGVARQVISIGVNGSVNVAPDGRSLVFLHQRMAQPPEVATATLGGTPSLVTRTNAELLSKLTLPTPETVSVPGAGGAPVQMWILKPPHFDANKKYPLVFWVHGGPQGAFLDSWSTRWNPQVWAAQGYVLALPNPRGSTGFGQQFTDEISHDWGGKVFEDLMACLAYLEKQPYIDATRMASAGASYGGYMMNWFQGHTDKFKTLVTHCGVYNFTAMYGTTEELWFDEWEHGIPWEQADFEKYSPHRYAAKFKTPNLIIHNELDFRVPLSEGLQLFTTLQRKGVPSKLVVFPDEGHWVLKPQNSERWHQEIFTWLAEYLKKD